MSARQLIDRGREHVAAGRGTDALQCFAMAAEDPVDGPEALSLLAAAYLLPGVGHPALALTSVRRVATTPAVGLEHLTRCAVVALTAGDPVLAEELANRAETHVAGLMEQGRQRWQTLTELGQRFGAVEWELSQLGRQATGAAAPSATAPPAGASAAEAGGGAGSDLGEAWAAFEAQQDLEALKQRLQR